MNLNTALFWDTDPQKLDYDKHARYIISRVVMFGRWLEWKEVLNYYGRDRIAEEMKNERELDIKSVHFLSLVLNVPLNEFKCYINKQ